jgi:hypothetical protein
MSYEKASEGAQKLCGIAVSEGTVKNLVLEEGTEVLRQKEQERKKVWEQGQNIPSGEGKGRVFVQVDGTGINDRVEILDKRTYATTEDISAFREHFVLEAQKYGVFKSKEVIFVSDGANWCRQLKEEYFPEAIYVLDFWHLAKNIKVCLGAERKELVGQLLALAGRGAAGELLGRLWKLLRYNRDPTMRAKLLELIKYISSNKDGIENASRMDFYGSGPVEKAIDVTICRRFKKRGMSCDVHKANPLLALRLLKLNGEWDAYWRGKGVTTV